MGQLTNQPTKNSYIEKFQAFLKSPAFPCVGAKSAVARDQIEYLSVDDIRDSLGDKKITETLQAFAAKCKPDSLFVSFIVIFENTPSLNEKEFEYFLWERLQAMHEIDYMDYDWDKEVSSDPESAQFSLSIGGKSFYVVGLHPNSSRPGRQFDRPAMVFNLHSQFELLKEGDSYGKIQQTIRDRDEKINGDINPMLADHGVKSEARQYSGRELEQEWKCPFQRMMRKFR